MRIAGFVVALYLVTLQHSCSILDPGTVDYDYYVLEPSPQAQLAPQRPSTTEEHSAVVSLGRISLPEYLQREAIATRRADHRIVYSQTDRWAEPLDVAFERLLRQDLARAMAPHNLVVQPSSITSPPDFLVEVDVGRFERTEDSDVVLQARWRIRGEGRLLSADELRITKPLSQMDTDETASAMSGAISALARAIAGDVLSLQEHRNEAPSAKL